MAFVNNWLVSGLPFGGKKREITKEEEIKLRIRIDEEVEDLKRLGASDEIINDFLARCEKIFNKKQYEGIFYN